GSSQRTGNVRNQQCNLIVAPGLLHERFAQAHGQVQQDLPKTENFGRPRNLESREGIVTEQNTAAAFYVGEFLREALRGGLRFGGEQKHRLQSNRGAGKSQRRRQTLHFILPKFGKNQDQIDIGRRAHAAFGGASEQDDRRKARAERGFGRGDEVIQ